MKYRAYTREHDFDLYLFDNTDNQIFCALNAKYSDVSSLFNEETTKHYLAFQTISGAVSVLIDLPVQDHMDLLESLRIFND